jgi:hypothetical protein
LAAVPSGRRHHFAGSDGAVATTLRGDRKQRQRREAEDNKEDANAFHDLS